jgi:O-acetyl-ADP-ribose deacetylase (regulator of RNase III)
VVKYIKGDLFATDCEIIAHGVNCRNAFGSGVASTVSRIYPKAKSMYHEKYDEEGWRLGDVQFVLQNNDKYIANCATQDNFGYSGHCNADYPAMRVCMEKIKAFAKHKGLSIAMPKIGAGLAGGDWNIIEKILEQTFVDYDVTVYCL